MRVSLPIAVILWVVSWLPAAALDQKAESEEFFKLLSETVPQRSLPAIYNLIEHPENAKDKEEVVEAQKQLEKTRENIPKLRQLIRVGSSIFDYPGILSYGSIGYFELTGLGVPLNPGTNDYRIHLGLPITEESVSKWGFIVVFDEKGTVTAVRDDRLKK